MRVLDVSFDGFECIIQDISCIPSEILEGIYSLLLIKIDDTLSVPLSTKTLCPFYHGKAFSTKHLIEFKGNSIRILTGLLPKVQKYLTKYGFTLQYQTNYSRFDFDETSVLSSFLYDHQVEIVKAAIKYKRGIIQSPTASGKSMVIAELCRIFSTAKASGNILVTVPTIALLHQMKADMLKFCEIGNHPLFDIGLIGDGKLELNKPISICIPDTAGNKLIANDPTFLDFVRGVNVLIADEVHECGNTTYMYLNQSIKNRRISLGLSIGGNSRVLLREAGITRIATIEEFFNDQGLEVEGEWIYTQQIEVRSFSKGEFTWKPLKGVYRHKPNNKKCFRIVVEKGRELVVTEDHSLYTIKGPVNNPSLHLSTGAEIKTGDYLFAETDIEENINPVEDFNIAEYLVEGMWYAASEEFKPYIPALAPNRYEKYNWLKSKMGPCLPLEIYSKHFRFSCSHKIFSKSCNGTWINSKIPSKALSYLLGYYLGNGWLNGNRVCFSVPKTKLPFFLNYLESLKQWMYINPSVSDRFENGAVEITLCNKALRLFIGELTQYQKALTKRIPSLVFNMSQEFIREFIFGMLDSDGTLSVKDNKRRHVYTTKSKHLAYDLIELLKYVGVVAGCHASNRNVLGGIIKGRQYVGRNIPTYQIHFSEYEWLGNNTSKFGRRELYKLESGLALKVLKVEEVSPDYVYDFSVDNLDYPAFVANGFLVHNSATPWCNTGANLLLEGMFGPKIKEIPESVMIDKGIIMEPRFEFYNAPTVYIPPKLLGRDYSHWLYNQIYQIAIVNNVKRNELIVDLTINLIKEKQGPVIIIVNKVNGTSKSKSHAEVLVNLLSSKGYNIPILSGNNTSKERDNILQQLKDSNIDCICSGPKILTAGVNIPSLYSIVLAGGGSSDIQMIQRIGRVLRLNKNKAQPKIIDLIDSQSYFANQSKKRISIAEEVYGSHCVNIIQSNTEKNNHGKV